MTQAQVLPSKPGAPRRGWPEHWQALLLVVILGTALRMAVASFGHNFDFVSFSLVSRIVSSGGNVYAETSRYNYGPVWFTLLGMLGRLASSSPNPEQALADAISALLTLVDLGILGLLVWRSGLASGFLFFLNPVSIIITGYHRQFDNLAILLALAGVLLYGETLEAPVRGRKLLGLLVLGLSLMTKHVFLAFPLWLALKQKGWLAKLLVLAIPVAVFLIGFAPYWGAGHQGIISNVFLYRPDPAFENAPFWHWFIPNLIRAFMTSRMVFAAAVVLAAFAFRKLGVWETALVYTAVLVITSPTIANQYLAIPLAFVAVRFNLLYLVYILFASWHLLIDPDGLHLTRPAALPASRTITFGSIIVALGCGFLWQWAGRRALRWAAGEVRVQLGRDRPGAGGANQAEGQRSSPAPRAPSDPSEAAASAESPDP